MSNTRNERKTAQTQMYDLVRMHFEDAFAADDYHTWDWSVPYYLIDNEPGWSKNQLEALVDFYHNGPADVR